MENEENDCTLILTYPLAQRLEMTYAEQYLIYALIMDIFSHNKSKIDFTINAAA